MFLMSVLLEILVQAAKSNIAAAQDVAQQASPPLGHEHLDTAQAVLQSGGHLEQVAAAVSAARLDAIDAPSTAEGQLVVDKLTTAAHQLDLARSRRTSARPGISRTRAVVLEHSKSPLCHSLIIVIKLLRRLYCDVQCNLVHFVCCVQYAAPTAALTIVPACTAVIPHRLTTCDSLTTRHHHTERRVFAYGLVLCQLTICFNILFT